MTPSNRSKSWRYDKPTEDDPGESVFALVVFTESGEIGVRSLERAYVRKEWKKHVFAWQPIDYPGYTISVMKSVVDMHKESQQKPKAIAEDTQ